MTVWFTSDLHLGHANIIRYSGRPFRGLDEMHGRLVAAWNERVADDDVVWILGDLALGKADATLPLVGALRGHKILLAGNHDRCWHGHRRPVDAWTRRYLDAGIAEVRQRTATTTVGGTQVLLCHFPYHGDSHDADRHLEHRPVDQGQWLLHGHVHERWRQRGRMVNVGVDAWNQRPVGEDELASLLRAGPRNLSAHGAEHR